MKKKLGQYLPWIVGISYMVYVVLRAIKIPITHDEGATLLNQMRFGYFDLLTYGKDDTPNNHVLNSMGIKFLSQFFGFQHITARIPALTGGLLYVLSTFAIAWRVTGHTLIRWTIVALLLGNPFLAEFFALARGYGLAAGLMLSAIYFALIWLEQQRIGQLSAALVLAVLSVEANFTLLNFFVPFMGLLAFATVQRKIVQNGHLYPLFMVLGASILLAGMVYFPIKAMNATDQFRFWGNTGFFKETAVPLADSTLCGWKFLGGSTSEKVAGFAVALGILSIFYAIFQWKNKKWQIWADPYVFGAALFFGALLVNILQHFLLKTPYLNARTALFFYPLFALSLGASLESVRKSIDQKVLMGIAIFFMLLPTINFFRNANLTHTYEWGFDRYTYKVLAYLKEFYEKEGRDKPMTFNSSTLLSNSMAFHIEHSDWHYKQYLKNAPWHGNTPTEDPNEFYYSTNEELPIISKRFDTVFSPSEKFHLMRLKPVYRVK